MVISGRLAVMRGGASNTAITRGFSTSTRRGCDNHRHAWFALPFVMLAFVVLGLAMVPAVLLVAATGIGFGLLLGPVYAMSGCLASASTGFREFADFRSKENQRRTHIEQK